MYHLAPEETVTDLAKDAQPQSIPARVLESPLLAAVEAQKAQAKKALLATTRADSTEITGIADGDQQLAARRHADHASDDQHLDLQRYAQRRFGDGRDARFVLVAQGQVQDEVFTPLETQLVQPAPDRWRRVDLVRRRHQPPRTRTASASTRPLRGRAATPTAARAGKGSAK
jgi:hypothetical protein